MSFYHKQIQENDMATKLMTLRIEEELKDEFDAFCYEVGLTTTSAVTMFVKATVREQRIPFEISTDKFYSSKNMEVLAQSRAELERGEYTDVSSDDFDALIESL